MSDQTGIEWTDATWNPVRGCVKVSPGCAHCYAETFAERFRGVPGHPYEQGFDLRLVPEKLQEPLTWKNPRRVFVNSMSDLFQDGVPDQFLHEVYHVMEYARQHTFQVLTKRAARMRDYLAWRYGEGRIPSRHIWHGVSVENQHFADERIPLLLQTPSRVRFISAEPLLGPVDLESYVDGPCPGCGIPDLDCAAFKSEGGGDVAACCPDCRHVSLDWVIVGGESGPQARLMRPEWARTIRDQCQAACVPFFFKQWGAVMSDDNYDMPGHVWQALDAAHNLAGVPPKVWRIGKKAAGRLLDGREWNEYPCAVSRGTSPPKPTPVGES